MSSRYWMTLFSISLAIALTACKANVPNKGQDYSEGPAGVEIDKRKLTPVRADQIQPAKELLKTLGATANLETFFLSESEPSESKYSLLPESVKSVATDIKNGCSFTKNKSRPDIPPDKLRVGSQFQFGRDYESAGDRCLVKFVWKTDANLTFWSVDKADQSGAIRTRAEIRQESEFQDARHIEAIGYKEAKFKFRVIEDGHLGKSLRTHLRSFGSGHILLNQQGRIDIRTRSEHLIQNGRSNLVMRLRTKSAQGQNFSYSFQVELTGPDLKIVKAYVGNVPLTEGEIGELKVAAVAGRFIVSIQ